MKPISRITSSLDPWQACHKLYREEFQVPKLQKKRNYHHKAKMNIANIDFIISILHRLLLDQEDNLFKLAVSRQQSKIWHSID